ncbi:HAMP domain-containing histidine kinase [Actinocrinis puniceicyclus]|uniref:histidine kinase n=1 Tax=Actinocrinis puniceicyclus TaxID=977794 RepID=A0A8J7WLT2_9ACTN|nr:HAMP domain-containing sensor histidine kinase [Actinocrinis puniceicyclus]MBS2964738.1 HAMP domain-containing histidine kinase [Actinocrinis puniceicyclus]
MSDLVLIILIGGGSAIGVGVLGLLALRLLRGRSMRLKLFAVAMFTVLAMVAGVLAAAQAMFLSQHDFGVALVVCIAAGLVALAMAIPLARSVTADSRALRNAMRALGDEEHEFEYSVRAGGRHAAPGPALADRPAPVALATAELDDLRRELTTTGARLAESRERERALERSRRELVAWVSHDLRTPLAGLRAMAEALEDGVATDPLRYHTQIRMSVDRLAGMVDDLFEMSRIHAGALRLTLERVPLTDLVDEAVVGADPLARACGVALEADVRTPLAVRVDPRELSRALTNLVANAIRHTPSDGAVRVEAIERDGHAVLAVVDACGGIPDEDLDRVFEVAWRGTAARTPEPLAGAGLGLAIVRGIVEAHAGEVDVRNVAGGCRFEVRLPVPVG